MPLFSMSIRFTVSTIFSVRKRYQNVLAFRFANGIFEPLWNRNYIDYVEITAVENLGIEQRGGFYETAGALRDMVQNHLIQLSTLRLWNRLLFSMQTISVMKW